MGGKQPSGKRLPGKGKQLPGKKIVPKVPFSSSKQLPGKKIVPKAPFSSSKQLPGKKTVPNAPFSSSKQLPGKKTVPKAPFSFPKLNARQGVFKLIEVKCTDGYWYKALLLEYNDGTKNAKFTSPTQNQIIRFIP